MTLPIVLGIIILVLSIITFGVWRFKAKGFENRLAIAMIAFTLLTVSIALFGIGEFPGARRERAKKCLEEGYSAVVDYHSYYGESFAENIDDYVVLQIKDSEQEVYLKEIKEVSWD